jgi:hypothetical protein
MWPVKVSPDCSGRRDPFRVSPYDCRKLSQSFVIRNTLFGQPAEVQWRSGSGLVLTPSLPLWDVAQARSYFASSINVDDLKSPNSAISRSHVLYVFATLSAELCVHTEPTVTANLFSAAQKVWTHFWGGFTLISDVSVPYQCRPCDVRQRNTVACILNKPFTRIWSTERTVLRRKWPSLINVKTDNGVHNHHHQQQLQGRLPLPV